MPLDYETRTAIAQTCRTISSDSTVAAYHRVKITDVIRIRRSMPQRVNSTRTPIGPAEPISKWEMDGVEEQARGCNRLRDAMLTMYKKRASELNSTPEYAQLLLSFGREQAEAWRLSQSPLMAAGILRR